jgi:hypothetical protein
MIVLNNEKDLNGGDASVKDLPDLPLQDAVDKGKNVKEEERCQARIKYCAEGEGNSMFPLLGVGEDTLFSFQT